MKYILLSCVVLCASAGLTFLSAGGRGAPDYYPLKAGSKWDYRVMLAGKILEGKTVKVIDKSQVNKGQTVAVQKTFSADGKVGAVEYLSSSPQGVFRQKFNGEEAKPPVQLLKYPIKPGDTWEGEHMSGNSTSKIAIKVGDFQQVQVPAGMYNAVPVTLATTEKGQSVATTYWFADGVGVVKQTAKIGMLDVTMELEKFTPVK